MKGRYGFVLMLLCLSACSSWPGARAQLAASTWRLVAINGEAFVLPEAEAQPFFSLKLYANGRMSVWAGCNDLQGSYQHEGKVLRIGPFDEIKRQCDTAAMQCERQVMRALEGASYYQLEGGELSLRNPIGIEQARFRAAPAKN